MTDQEFFDYYHIVGDQQQCLATNAAAANVSIEEELLRDVPAHWDWRDYGIVSPVKNQGTAINYDTESGYQKGYSDKTNFAIDDEVSRIIN